VWALVPWTELTAKQVPNLFMSLTLVCVGVLCECVGANVSKVCTYVRMYMLVSECVLVCHTWRSLATMSSLQLQLSIIVCVVSFSFSEPFD